MRICVIGSGIAGLSAAFYLAQLKDTEITVCEQAAAFGGRASVAEDGEHCARIFLADYNYMFSILRTLRYSDTHSVYDMLTEIDRYCYIGKRGWVQISHLYVMLARELSMRDRLRVVRDRSTSPLLAERRFGADRNLYHLFKNISVVSLLKIMANIVGSRVAYALEGPTDKCLLIPWIAYLKERGVSLERNCRVNAVQANDTGVTVRSIFGERDFDIVIFAGHASDTIELLNASEIPHLLNPAYSSLHWKCVTFALKAEEKIFQRKTPAIYSLDGINVLLQPHFHRCVALCIRSRNTEIGYIAARVREILGLEYEILSIKERENREPRESVFAAHALKPGKILRDRSPVIYFAGSCVKNSYLLDSGEGAVRSAFNAVQAIKKEHHLIDADTAAV